MKRIILSMALFAGASSVMAQSGLAVAPLNLPSQKIGFQDNGSLDLGFYTARVKGVQFADFDISDCSIYGLKSQDSNSKESRYRIPLGKLADKTWQLYGFHMGMRWNYAKKVQGALYLRAAFGQGATIGQASFSASPQLITRGRFRVSGELEFGGTLSSVKVSNVNPLKGYHQYYRAEGFDLKPGDDVYIDNSDLFVTAGLGLQYALTNHSQLYTNISLNRSIWSGKFSLYHSDNDEAYLESGSAYVVAANELSAKPTAIQPNLIRVGPVVSFGIRFDLGGYPEEKVKRCECCGQEIYSE